MSVVRFFVLLAGVFVFMPADNEQRTQMWEQSKKVLAWTMTTCERNPQYCETATDLWDRVKRKSTRSAALVNEMIGEQLPEMPAAISGLLTVPEFGESAPVDTGTLLPRDLIPDWRG